MDKDNNLNKTNASEKTSEKITKLRSQFMLKKGAYSITLIAFVLAALILLNWLVATLGARFHLEFDMTPDKTYSVNEENLDYIKNVKDKITITVCGAEYDYISSLSQLAEYYYSVVGGDDYYDQTLELLKKYDDYSDNINLVFLDSSTLEYKAVIEKYKDENLFFCDIIVTKDNSSRYKVVHYKDIYEFESDELGEYYYVSGNKLETALTSAISYCVAEKTPKAVVFTGHSSEDYSQYYVDLLKNYNYDFDIMGNSMITEISDEYDMAVIIAPTSDFTDDELGVISAFLENGGKLSKSLVYIANIAAKSLPNFEEFLSQWGIVDSGYMVIDEDMMEYGYYLGDQTLLISEPVADDDNENFDSSILSGIDKCITGKNAPLEIGKPSNPLIKVNGVLECGGNTVVARLKADGESFDLSEKGAEQCYTVIEAVKANYDTDNNYVKSYVYAFSSMDFISNFAELEGYSNKDIIVACSDRAVNYTNDGLNFITKTIVNDGYIASDNAKKVARIFFEWVLPLAIVAVSIFVYVKRRNA